jgi:methyl-accepting chemotaxis protein
MIPAAQPVQSVARRVSIIGSASLAAVLLCVSVFMSVDLTGRERDWVAQWVGEKTQAIVNDVDAFDVTSRVLVDKFYTSFASGFAPDFALDAADGTLSNHGEKLNGSFDKVDAFAQSSGGVATVFARKGDDFERITTSLKNEKGDRAMGTLLDRKHPAYANILDGKTYVGRATLFGKPYMTRYEPIRQDGRVIGILFIGFDLSAFQASIDKLASDTKFFETGGVYIVDPKKQAADALFVVHPGAKGKKVLEAFPGAEAFIAALGNAGDAEIANATPILRAGAKDSFVLMRKSQATGWWVVAEVSETEAMRAHWSAMWKIWSMMAATTVALGVGLLWMIRRWVSRPLRHLSDAVTSMGSGDMTRSFSSGSRDEIGKLVRDLESMRVRLLGVLRQVRQSAESVATGSTEIATGNADLSQRTEEQAANLQQTAAAMVHLTSTITQNSSTAQQATQIAGGARDAASRGGAVVGDVVATMQGIAESSKRIGAIIGTIDGIAFQTNILALNAAVEAARAGEQGRGFAVVASEVRSLAQRSAEAAKEIKGLVGESVERVEAGSRLVDDAGRSMEDIVVQVGRVSELIAEISAASSEQTGEIGQVGDAVQSLDTVTQQNAALVEESAAAADSLRLQAHRLVEAAAVFKLGQD